MNRILAPGIILAAVLIVSGCISLSGAHAPQAGQAVVTASAVPAGDAPSSGVSEQASPSPASAQNVHPFDPGRASWVDYKMTDLNGGGATDVRLDYSDRTVNGMSMKTVKRTVSYNSDSGSSGDDYSYDPGSNMLNVKTFGSSSSSSTGTESSLDQMKANDPVLASGDLSYSPLGQETVTVPYGTYNCDKYEASFNGAEGTFWASEAVPVPVKIVYDNKIMELTDWK